MEPVRIVAVALVAVLLVVVPLDLARSEPTLAEGQHFHCQLHANPGVNLDPTPLVVTRSTELLPLTDTVAHFPLLGSPIFIPPRA